MVSQPDHPPSSPTEESDPGPPGKRAWLSFVLTLTASLGTFGFFAVQGIILARLLGPTDRGVFAAAMMFPQILLYLGLLGAPELFAGYAAEGRPNGPLRRSAARYGLTAGVISMLACWGLAYLTFPQELRYSFPLAILCALTMPLQQVRLSVQAVDHGQRHLNRYNVVRLLAAALFPLLLLGALIFVEPYAAARDSANANDSVNGETNTGEVSNAAEFSESAGTTSDSATSDSEKRAESIHPRLKVAGWLFLIAQLLALGLAQLGMNESWFGPRAISVRKALREGRGLMGAWLSTELLERIDLVLVMVLVADKATLGFYAAAVPIASLMIVIPNAAGLYAFNRGARPNERPAPRDIFRYITLGLVVQIVCAAVLAAALPVLVPFFYTDEFRPSIQLAWLLLPAGVFRGLLQAADSYLRARKKPALGVKARAIGIPVLLTISFVGYPWLGVSAIPIGLSIAQGLCFCIVAAAVIQDTRDVGAKESA